MVRLSLDTLIHAPIALCFDLARDMNTHVKTMAKSGERIIACPEGGLLELGDEVTFEAKHLGIRQRLTSKIIQFERPSVFTDKMLTGVFKSLRHEHRFRIDGESTLMTDVLELEAPFGFVGWMAERAFLARYMHRVLSERGKELKAVAEASSAEQDAE
jgi:ligand-binding SRPBCC domain-containing protein